MKPCFGYVRVSTQKQGEGVSLEAQKDAIERFAVQNDIAITQWFEEKQTAAKSGRPIFSAMIKALRAGKADGLVMHKIDRSARNFRDWARIGELSDSGVDVHFATETLDFRSRGGRLSADIQAVIAADYIRNLREEIQKGVRGQLERGLYPLKAPIGYLNNGGGKLKTLDPIRSPLVKQTFELYASGQYSIRSLLIEIERLGLCSDSGQPISKGCLEKMLSNPFYTSIIKIRKTGVIYQGAHEALITAQLYETVQDVKKGRYNKKNTRHHHVYRGLFNCGHCGRAMIPERQKGHVYYRCQVQDCPRNCIREELIEKAIYSVLQRVRMSEEQSNIICSEIERWLQERVPENQAKGVSLQLSQLKAKLESLTDALIDRLIDQDTFNTRKQTILLEQARLKKQQHEMEGQRFQPSQIRKFLELVKNLADHYLSADPTQRRAIVDVATTNRRVANKNVYLEPENWLIALDKLFDVFCCAESRTTSRTFDSKEISHIEQLAEAARSPEANRLFELFMDGYRNAAGIGAGQNANTPRMFGSFAKASTDHANRNGI